jgi:hypothetical protein
VLVTVTPRLRVHRDEVILALVQGNTLFLRFVSMKPLRIPIDELTSEARRWLLPSLAPRAIPVDVEEEESTEPVEEESEARERAR